MKPTPESQERQHKIAAADGMLRGIPHLEDQIRHAKDRIHRYELDLATGCVQSPAMIRGPDQYASAKEARHVRIIMKKEEDEEILHNLLRQKANIEGRIHRLSDYDQQLLDLRYIQNKSYHEIGKKLYISKDTARRQVDDMLSRL